jgi:superfamily II DNA or RNA helicase
MSYCDIGGRSYINLLDKLLPVVEKAGYDVDIEDKRHPHSFEFKLIDENFCSNITWPKGHPLAGLPIEVKGHQVGVVNEFLFNPTGIAVAATGSGKSLITAILSKKVEPYGRSIVIVPSKDLVTQTEEDYLNLGLDVGVYFGGRKDVGKTHTICTWQSLEVLNKNKKGLDLTIDEFLKDVICVISDETHKSKSNVLRGLLSGPFANVPIRWGLTGTMPEAEFEHTCVVACIGPVLGKVTAKSLQDQGILANLHINVWQYQDVGDVFKDYQAELKWLTTNKARLQHLADRIVEVSETGNVLILIDRIETGKLLESMIPGSKFLNGNTKSVDRKDEYKSM